MNTLNFDDLKKTVREKIGDLENIKRDLEKLEYDIEQMEKEFEKRSQEMTGNN